MTENRSRARGELEAEVMQVLWANGLPLYAKEILELLPGKQPAYTTILTVLERLQRKGDVVRVGTAQRGIQFQAARSESEHFSQAMLNTLERTRDRSAALLKFTGNLEAADIELLRKALSPKLATDLTAEQPGEANSRGA